MTVSKPMDRPLGPRETEIAKAAKTKRDPNTMSNYDLFRTAHTNAILEIDFEKKVLKGTVSLILESLKEAKEGDEVVLDTRLVFFRYYC